MNSRLILVEGIPGAGKTTTARKIKEKLIDEGKEAILYEEGMSHPADMAWNACLKEDEYNDFIKKCSEMWEGSKKSISKEELISRIQRQTRIEDNNVILAYTKIDFPEDCYWSLIGDVASKEICDGRKSLDEFRDIHLRRWSKFAEQALLNDNIYIFECAFLQNHIFELLGVYEKSDEEIYLYLKSLLETVKSLSPSIVYIEPSSVEDIIIQAANERKSPEGSRPDWIDEVANWVSNMNFGKSHNLKGIEGVFYFCKERLRIDKLMIEKLNVSVTIIKR
ncbi:MAG: hypothetical protein ACLTA9_09625 [Clostridium saudiense]|jgi:hypothetical protein|uniref:hypothetical protein n=1 Tax=Clostridium TaxID=1485 RepID=UPI0018AAF6EA|nr:MULTISPECIES: hypothetical protein [Clostridium]MBX9185447.1 hypothetical protein [Clostridium sp. K04]